MILKCCLAGLLTVLAGAVISVLSIFCFLLLKAKSEGTTLGWDPVSMFRNSVFPWILVAGIFLAGFYWEYHKAAH